MGVGGGGRMGVGGGAGFPITFGHMPFSDQLSHLSDHN